MRKLFQIIGTIMLLLPQICYSQLIGSNGTNVPENLTAETRQYIADIWGSKPYELRVRQDKDPLNDAVINNILELDYLLNQKGSWVDITFTFNTRGEGFTDWQMFDKLVELNFNIVAAEMGNEEWAIQLSPQEFMKMVYPIIDSLNKRGFTGSILFPIAPRPKELGAQYGSRTLHTNWNNYLIPIINANPKYAPAFHIYFNANDAPIIGVYEKQKLPLAASYNDFFKTLSEQVTASNLVAATLTYAQDKFPTKKVWITEGIEPVSAGNFSNTFGYELCRLYGLEQASKFDNVQAVFIHNGVNTTNTGFISERKRHDVAGSEYIKRLGYYALDLYLNKPQDAVFIYNTPDVKGRFVTASSYDQSAGWCEWWLTTRAASYDVVMSDVSTPISFGYQFETTTQPVCDTVYIPYIVYDTTITQRVVYDTIITPYKAYDTLITQRIVYDTIVKIVPVQKVTYDLVIDHEFPFQSDEDNIFFSRIDTISWIKYVADTSFQFHIEYDTTITSRTEYDTVINFHVEHDTIITSRIEYRQEINCDTIVIPPVDTTPIFQPLDADTLLFNNEIEFRDFLFHYGLSTNYDVLPAKFNPEERFEDVVPFKYMTNKAGHLVWCPDPNYYKIYDGNGAEIFENLGYLHEEGFAGKRYVAIFDHSGLAKSYREFYTEQCHQGDWRTVDIIIVNPLTNQTAIFKKGFVWADRNGEQIFNNNLKTWLLWGKDAPEATYDFRHFLPDSTSGCDFTFREVNPEHDVTQLRWKEMNATYGYLRVK